VNTIEPSMCGGDAAFLSNCYDHLLKFGLIFWLRGKITMIFPLRRRTDDWPGKVGPRRKWIYLPASPSVLRITFRLSTRARVSSPTREIPQVYSVDPSSSLSVILLSLSAFQSVHPALLHIHISLSLLLHFKLFILISQGSMPPRTFLCYTFTFTGHGLVTPTMIMFH